MISTAGASIETVLASELDDLAHRDILDPKIGQKTNHINS